MADAGARRHDLEIVERLGAPFEELIAFAIALIFQLDIFLECLRRAEFVDHHRMVDHKMHRHLRIDLFRITAQLRHRIAHRRQIDHARHAGEILHQHARRTILDFAIGTRVLLPIDDRLHIIARDGGAVLETQHVLQQHLHRKGQAADVAIFFRRHVQRVIVVGFPAGLEGFAGVKRVLADRGHCGPFGDAPEDTGWTRGAVGVRCARDSKGRTSGEALVSGIVRPCAPGLLRTHSMGSAPHETRISNNFFKTLHQLRSA